MTLFTSDGLLVRNKSRVFPNLVGTSTTWLKLKSYSMFWKSSYNDIFVHVCLMLGVVFPG